MGTTGNEQPLEIDGYSVRLNKPIGGKHQQVFLATDRNNHKIVSKRI